MIFVATSHIFNQVLHINLLNLLSLDNSLLWSYQINKVFCSKYPTHSILPSYDQVAGFEQS